MKIHQNTVISGTTIRWFASDW